MALSSVLRIRDGTVNLIVLVNDFWQLTHGLTASLLRTPFDGRDMLGICYFTCLNWFIASPMAALLAIPLVDTLICSNVLNFAL